MALCLQPGPTGQQALDTVFAGGVDVLVLDLRLPVINGLQLYLELKKRGQALPTVIVTGSVSESAEAAETFRDLSITGVLLKPFEPGRLLQAMEGIVQRAA